MGWIVSVYVTAWGVFVAGCCGSLYLLSRLIAKHGDENARLREALGKLREMAKDPDW
jgi:hypothetical protein